MHSMKRAIAFTLSIIIPLFFISTWLMQNQMLPSADGADYLSAGVNIYQKFIYDGFLSGLNALYSLRGWRPILFPVITVPLLGLSNGSLLFAYNGSIMLIMFMCALYVYSFMRLKLDRMTAMISTVLICLLPSTIAPTLYFFAESLLLPFVIGSLYHLIKKQNMLFIMCVTIAVLLRPVEAATTLILPLSYYLFYSYKHDRKEFKVLIINAIVITLLVSAWYLPFYTETFEWIYQTSFGEVAKSDPRKSISIIDNIKTQLSAEGIVPVLGICLIAMMSRFKNAISKEIICLLLLIPIPLAEVLFTLQNSPRKFTIAFTALLMAGLMIGMKRGIVCIIAIALIIFQLLYTNIQKPISFKVNPYDKALNYLIDQHKKYNFKSVNILLRTTGNDPIDPFSFRMMISAKNPGFYPGYSFFTSLDDNSFKKLHNYDVIFLSDNANKMIVSTNAAKNYYQQFIDEKANGHKMLDYFLYMYAANKLNELGWYVADCMEIASVNNENYRGCLLAKKTN